MPQADLSQYPYIPALQSSAGEQIGYQKLDAKVRKALLPIFELSQRGNAPNLEGSISSVKTSAAKLPFILDLSKEAAPPPYIALNPQDPEADKVRVEREKQAQESYNAQLKTLLNPAGGFSAWRELADDFPNAIPAVQYTDATSQSRQILRQATLLSKGGQTIAVRINAESAKAMAAIVPNIISVLESPDQVLIILDCGQGRIQIPKRAAFAVDTAYEILNVLDVAERPLMRVVCLSNSFTSPTHDGLLEYDNLDWKLWLEASESFPFVFGDYAATYRRQRRNTFVPPDFRATVVCPLPEMWLYYRDENANDADGWATASVEIAKKDLFAEVPTCWGKSVIQSVASNGVGEFNSARFWYAAKVNIHLTTQSSYAPPLVAGAEDSGETD